MMKTITMGAVCLVLTLSLSVVADVPSGTSSPAEPQLSRYRARLSRTAASALVMSVINAGLHAASDVMWFYDHETPGTAMGITGLGLSLGLTPVFYLSNRSAYRKLGVGGIPALRVWGFTALGLSVADMLGVVIAGYAAAVTPMYGLITVAGIFSAVGFSLFAVDGLTARKRHRTSTQATCRRRERPTVTPYVTPLPATDLDRPGTAVGLAGRF